MKTASTYATLRLIIGAFVSILALRCAVAEELKYQPVNPSFGGNPFNGPYLLGSATAQRQFREKREKYDVAKEFAEDIKRSIMGRVSQEIADQMIGENARESGRFSVGGVEVDFHRQGDQVVININDAESGGSTTIEMPVPRY